MCLLISRTRRHVFGLSVGLGVETSAGEPMQVIRWTRLEGTLVPVSGACALRASKPRSILCLQECGGRLMCRFRLGGQSVAVEKTTCVGIAISSNCATAEQRCCKRFASLSCKDPDEQDAC